LIITSKKIDHLDYSRYGYLVETDVEVLNAMALPLGIYVCIYVCLYIHICMYVYVNVYGYLVETDIEELNAMALPLGTYVYMSVNT
jgi:hypothetical protein